MGNIADQKMAIMKLLRVFGVSFCAHLLPDIPTKHNVKETASKGNIRGAIYVPNFEGLSGG